MLPQFITDAIANAERYAKVNSLTTEKSFGYGQEGYVFQTNKMTAVKAFYYQNHYRQELEIYEYLKKWKISEVSGFHIPELVSSADELRVIEMEVVSPPFILDFVGAQIDIPIEHEEGWLEHTMDLFESDRPRVKLTIWALQEEGVFLSVFILGMFDAAKEVNINHGHFIQTAQHRAGYLSSFQTVLA